MRIFRYVGKYWWYAVLSVVSMIFEVLMDLLQPKLMAYIVDYGILYANNKTTIEEETNPLLISYFNNTFLWGDVNPQIAIILNVGFLMIALVIFGGLCGVLSGVFANNAAYKYGNDLRKDVFKHTMSLSFEQTDNFTTGSLVTRMTNDITQVQNMVAMSIRMLIRCLTQFVLGIIMILGIKKEFGLILLIALPIECVVVVLFLKKVTPYFGKVQLAVDDVNAIVQENVTGARVVKAYNKETYETRRFSRANDRLYDINWKVFKIMAFISPIISLFLSGAMISVYAIGSLTIKSEFDKGIIDGLTVGEVMSAITYITIILMGFMMLAMLFQTFVRGAASVKRLNQVLDAKPVVKNGNNKDALEKGTIVFDKVNFKYGDSQEDVLKDISFKVNKGERIGILGSTGCGKTTLVNLITRFYDATNGMVLVDGKDVKNWDLKALRERVSVALQKSELYTYTIEENIKWGKKDATHEEVLWASKIAQADGFIESFEDGYDTMVAEKGASLSGGQKQRISIARTLIKKPEIVIFDDATSALDLATEADLYKALNSQMKDTTLLIIAQRIASVKNADKILVLNDGKVEAFDSHENLMKNCQIYIDIYNSQLKKDGDR